MKRHIGFPTNNRHPGVVNPGVVKHVDCSPFAEADKEVGALDDLDLDAERDDLTSQSFRDARRDEPVPNHGFGVAQDVLWSNLCKLKMQSCN